MTFFQEKILLIKISNSIVEEARGKAKKKKKQSETEDKIISEHEDEVVRIYDTNKVIKTFLTPPKKYKYEKN